MKSSTGIEFESAYLLWIWICFCISEFGIWHVLIDVGNDIDWPLRRRELVVDGSLSLTMPWLQISGRFAPSDLIIDDDDVLELTFVKIIVDKRVCLWFCFMWICSIIIVVCGVLLAFEDWMAGWEGWGDVWLLYVYLLLFVARPLPCQVRLHGRSKSWIKIYFIGFSRGGDGTGIFALFCPALPLLCACLVVPFFFLLSFPLFLFSLYAGLFTKRTSYATKTNKATTMQQSRMSMNSTTRGILLHPHNNLLQILFMVLTDMATVNNFIFISSSKIVVVHSLNTSSYNLFCLKLAAICTSLFVFILDIYLLL